MPNPLLQTMTQVLAPGKPEATPDPKGRTQPEVAFQDVLNASAETTLAGAESELAPHPDIAVDETREGDAEIAQDAAETPDENVDRPDAETTSGLPVSDVRVFAATNKTLQPLPTAQAALPAVDPVAQPVRDLAHVDQPPADRQIPPPAGLGMSGKTGPAFLQSGAQGAIQAKLAKVAKSETSAINAETPLNGAQNSRVRDGLSHLHQHHAPSVLSATQPVSPTLNVQNVHSVESGSTIEADIPDVAPIRNQPIAASRDTPIGHVPQPARAEIARAIAGQMAAVITPKSGAVEIALNPEELGRVSITFSGRDDGAYLTILADRPETLDLMRRHISVLSQEFQKLGYGDLSFDLGTSDGAHQNSRDGTFSTGDIAPDPHEDAGPAPHPRPIRPDGGLDMRL